ncbi:MAG: hypothetical protein CM1200mP24_08980 [Gammaproteobacteria bacterium]|nr:MAG: hypothetical protein CM1200mP24_08980 [Gammaproteobacteria bacterium]
MTGTKYGCGVAQCGACTVHIDGKAVRACVFPVNAVQPGQEVTTIEGLSENGDHPVQQAWAELDVPQCGYCQPGMIMASAALLNDKPKPTDADINTGIKKHMSLWDFAKGSQRSAPSRRARLQRSGETS